MITEINSAGTGRAAGLTAEEQAVLRVLGDRAGRVVRRSEIQELVWPGREGMSSSVVDRNIASLRRKLAGRLVINTFYGAGYILIRWRDRLN